MSRDWSDGDRELAAILTSQTPLLDVRAPVEFSQGHAPGAVNLPLLFDEERAAVGTAYKAEGPEAAIALGYRFVSGPEREKRVQAWVDFAKANPDARLYCFRGGLRSRLVHEALKGAGADVPFIEGGYKRIRNFLLRALDDSAARKKFVVISGTTGSGKTRLLRDLARELPVCDLEHEARHRGSAFGRLASGAQPSQACFENALAVSLLRLADPTGHVLIEDESRMIGSLKVPEALFRVLSEAPVFVIDEPREARARDLTDTYLRENYGFIPGEAPDPELIAKLGQDLETSLRNISKSLGGLESKSLLESVGIALREHERTGLFEAHHEWVERLLAAYYDPVYLRHLERISPRIRWRGPKAELRAALLDL